MEIKNRTIALLIDSDNISAKYLELLITEVSKFGDITYKRIYGDFTHSRAASWRKVLTEFAIEPIQQYLLSKKKKDEDREITFNVTDSAMIIDAMDILYSHKVNCVCLATSDSDFTRLAMRFRNENYLVIGAGEKKTPQPFRAACHRFLLMDALLAESEKSTNSQMQEAQDETPRLQVTLPKQPSTKQDDVPREADEEDVQEENTPIPLDKIVDIAKGIILEDANEDGWMLMSIFSSRLYIQVNTFDSRYYGYKMPTIMFKSLVYPENKRPVFELKKNEKNADLIRICSVNEEY